MAYNSILGNLGNGKDRNLLGSPHSGNSNYLASLRGISASLRPSKSTTIPKRSRPAPSRKTSITKKSIPKRSSSASSSSSSDYSYGGSVSRPNTQAQLAKSLASSNFKGPGSAKDITNWINDLKKELEGGEKGPKLPEQVNMDKFRTELATIKDLEKKYGFDYSRGYAEKQAEVLAQAQRDAIATSRERAEHETDSAKTDLEHDFFKKYLEQRQDTSNSGLNAGIASERNLRLDMNRQGELADILANEQLYNQELDRNSSTIDKEEQAYTEQLYNERLNQGFGQAMDMSQFQQGENHFQAQQAVQQRNQKSEEAWREFEFNNMSHSEKVKMIADAEKYGMDKAWERHKFDAGMQFDAASGGGNFNGSSMGGDFSTSKGEPPQAFKSHLSDAIRATGVDQSWIKPMSQLIANESSWNPSAKNPNSTAHGYAQFLNQTRKDYEKKYGIKYDTPTNQLILGIRYVQDRYGTPQKAMQFWNKNKWY